MKKTVLVTGSSGMIGTALCERLISEGFEVIGVDRVSNRWSQAVDQKTVLADLRKPDALEKISKKPDFFIHLAANAYVFNSVQNPQLAIDNILMTLNCLEFCRKKKISRFLFSSSREVYGNNSKQPSSEADVDISGTESPYAASKVSAESFISSYHFSFGIDYQIIRFSNVYGRYDDSDRLIPLLIRLNKKKEAITIFGKEKELPFTFLDDAVEAVILLIQKFEFAKNRSFNIAPEKPTRLLKVAELLAQKMGVKPKLVLARPRTGEVIRFSADVSKAKKLLGFVAQTPIERGLDQTLEWYSQNGFA
ncbi:MAG: NAD(P)-dependent oxidoreductase [Candidatus Micrarchaeota archaeon]